MEGGEGKLAMCVLVGTVVGDVLFARDQRKPLLPPSSSFCFQEDDFPLLCEGRAITATRRGSQP